MTLPHTLPDRLDGHRCIVIDRLRLPFHIGIFDHEKGRPQTVVISLRLFVAETGRARSTDIADHVSYAEVVDAIRAIAASGRHIPLVENLAEEIADIALSDVRVARVVVDVRKSDIIPEAEGVGVVIERAQEERRNHGR